MNIAPASRIGCYEVRSHIGTGGKGEVYRVRDTRLNREVPLKILTESFALDLDRHARLQREAKVPASLNHPNLAAISRLRSNEAPSLALEHEPSKAGGLHGPGALGNSLS
jgi:serine/threonine protein kinase